MFKRASLVGGAVIVLVVTLVVVRQGSARPDCATRDWTTRQLADHLATAASLRLIDVRETEEYATGHIPGAVLIPLGELQERLSELDTSDDIAVICRTGRRSAEAAKILCQAGYTRVYNVSGGMVAWEGPVVTGQ